MKVFKCSNKFIKVIEKYLEIDGKDEWGCANCLFSRGFFHIAFNKQKEYENQYKDLIDNESYSGCAARAFLYNKYFETNFDIFKETGLSLRKYNVGCVGDEDFQKQYDLRTMKFIPARNVKI